MNGTRPDSRTDTRPDARREPLLRRATGRVLRRQRQASGRTLADVATAARMSLAYLSEVERGRKEASSEVLAAICAALGITVADLVALLHAELSGAPRVLVLSSTPPRTGRADAVGTPLAARRTGSAPGPVALAA